MIFLADVTIDSKNKNRIVHPHMFLTELLLARWRRWAKHAMWVLHDNTNRARYLEAKHVTVSA